MKNYKNLLVFTLISSIILISSCKKKTPIPAPVANFTFTADNNPAPSEVTFSSTSTDAKTYSWEFGDGGSSTDVNPKHTYTAGGTFTVKLSVTGDGGTNSVTKSVTIQNAIPAPVANFTFTGDNNFAPRRVNFTNTSTNSTSYSWDFGDGQTSTIETPNHVYTSGGTFNVTLTVKNSVGTQNIINKTVTIKNAPTQLKINSMVLTAMPFTTASGGGWDSSNGPDVYFEYADDNNTNYATTLVYTDVLQSDLPLTFSASTVFPLTFSALDFQYRIDLYDYDSLGADDWIDGYYFTVRNSMPTNGDSYPTTIDFQSSSSQLKFTLNVEWVQ